MKPWESRIRGRRREMECIHRFQVDSQNIGTCSLCGEVRQFPYDKGEPVKVLKNGNNSNRAAKKEETVKKTERRNQGRNTQIQERHRYYEDNKEAIIADFFSKGRLATREKWGITSSSLHSLERRWLTKEQRSTVPSNPGRPKQQAHPSTNSTPSNGRLPPFPQFSDTWEPEVQLEWLGIYGRLAEKQPHPHVPA